MLFCCNLPRTWKLLLMFLHKHGWQPAGIRCCSTCTYQNTARSSPWRQLLPRRNGRWCQSGHSWMIPGGAPPIPKIEVFVWVLWKRIRRKSRHLRLLIFWVWGQFCSLALLARNLRGVREDWMEVPLDRSRCLGSNGKHNLFYQGTEDAMHEEWGFPVPRILAKQVDGNKSCLPFNCPNGSVTTSNNKLCRSFLQVSPLTLLIFTSPPLILSLWTPKPRN